MKRTLKDEYFDMLCGLVDITDRDTNMSKCYRHIHMLRRLNMIPFKVSEKAPMDENRWYNAIWNRYEITGDWLPNVQKEMLEELPADPSIFETIVRMAQEYTALAYEHDNAGPAFWMIIENLGLDKTDDWEEIQEICRVLVERDYDRYGHGSMFPQGRWMDSRPELDMSTTEIWRQADYYVQY